MFCNLGGLRVKCFLQLGGLRVTCLQLGGFKG